VLFFKTNIMANSFPVHAVASGLFKAAPEKVFRAWLDTNVISQFMFGPKVRDEEIVSLANEPIVGGKFSYIVRRNGHELNHKGEYLEIKAPDRLVFTWSVEEDEDSAVSRVVVDVAPVTDGSELTVTHEMPAGSENFVEQAKKAWGKMIDKLITALDGVS
jgi:uncharacterized protein YndB with AHSA1/START domain